MVFGNLGPSSATGVAFSRNPATGQREPFHYRDKGMLATIGRARAVGTLGGLRLTGLVAWLLWSGVHIFYLISFRQRILVMLDWIWSYLFFSGGARLITTAINQLEASNGIAKRAPCHAQHPRSTIEIAWRSAHFCGDRPPTVSSSMLNFV